MQTFHYCLQKTINVDIDSCDFEIPSSQDVLSFFKQLLECRIAVIIFIVGCAVIILSRLVYLAIKSEMKKYEQMKDEAWKASSPLNGDYYNTCSMKATELRLCLDGFPRVMLDGGCFCIVVSIVLEFIYHFVLPGLL
ncbi:MAG: hypothetical protein K5695_18370 [Oscillospiraceae bacterium]|nr:hypothetical protein [Oscillospiraceae bacterium]